MKSETPTAQRKERLQKAPPSHLSYITQRTLCYVFVAIRSQSVTHAFDPIGHVIADRIVSDDEGNCITSF
jgi:hypothetical protein